MLLDSDSHPHNDQKHEGDSLCGEDVITVTGIFHERFT